MAIMTTVFVFDFCFAEVFDPVHSVHWQLLRLVRVLLDCTIYVRRFMDLVSPVSIEPFLLILTIDLFKVVEVFR